MVEESIETLNTQLPSELEMTVKLNEMLKDKKVEICELLELANAKLQHLLHQH